MGIFNWPIRLTSIDGERHLDLDALVDTGATYTIVPADQLRELGVEPFDKIRLVLLTAIPWTWIWVRLPPPSTAEVSERWWCSVRRMGVRFWGRTP